MPTRFSRASAAGRATPQDQRRSYLAPTAPFSEKQAVLPAASANLASGTWSSVNGGGSNVASGQGSSVGGGQSQTATMTGQNIN